MDTKAEFYFRSSTSQNWKLFVYGSSGVDFHGTVSRVALISAIVAGPALVLWPPAAAIAADECGVASGTGTTVVVCGVGDPAFPTYPAGITYVVPFGLDLRFSPGVTVNTSTGNPGIQAEVYDQGDIVIDTTAGGIVSSGIGIYTYNGSIAPATVTLTTGDISSVSRGILVQNYSGGSTNINTTAGAVSTSDVFSAAIGSYNNGGTLTVSSGDVTTTGLRASGIDVVVRDGNGIEITTTSGEIQTSGNQSAGIVAGIQATAPISVQTGTISTSGVNSPGIFLGGPGTINVNTASGLISANGNGAPGIFILGLGPAAAGNIQTGTVLVTGDGGFGVNAAMLQGRDQLTGEFYTGAGSVSITSNGEVRAIGDDAGGIAALSYMQGGGPAGAVTVNANGNVTATGQNSAGIAAASGTGLVRVTVGSGATIEGGWSFNDSDRSSLQSFGPDYSIVGRTGQMGGNLPAAGIVVFSGATSTSPAMTITNNGIIGALNDRAITMGFPCASENGPVQLLDPCVSGMPATQSLEVANAGLIAGYVTLWEGGAHSFYNSGQFDVRSFSDSNGDGIRDKKSVAISDFGGPASTFHNLDQGVVRLAPVSGETTIDPTGTYVPTTGSDNRSLDANFYNIQRDGIVQGQFVNLRSFENVGTLDLRGSAVGNTLIITNSASTGNDPGGGEFVSNGGRLLVNSVLNAGMAPGGQLNSYSDMLVVDSTRLGTAPTSISVTNIGGSGELTPGNGIELVEVRNKNASDPRAFSLVGDYVTEAGGQAIIGGAYAYTLNHNGVGIDEADGNWYLRSVLIPEDDRPPEEELPLYQPGDPLFEVYPQALLSMNDLPTMQQRIGNRYWRDVAPAPTTVFCKDPSQNFRCTVSNEQASYYLGENDSTMDGSGLWTRIEGSFTRMKPRLSTTGSDYDTNLWKLQAGIDGLLRENAEGDRLIGGLTFHYGQVNANVSSFNYGSGDIHTSGYGFGGTITWLEQNGIYLDSQAAVTWFDSDINSDILGNLSDGNKGFGYALSLEVGKRIQIADHWRLTPQAQIIYSHVSFDQFDQIVEGRRVASVSISEGDSLVGRVGLSVDHEDNWKADDGTLRRKNVYGIINLYGDLLNGTSVDVSGTELKNEKERLWTGVGIGGTYNWNDDKYSLYGEASFNTSLADFADSYSAKGTLGFRVKW